MKTIILLIGFLLSYNCLQDSDILFCGEIKIKCEKNMNLFDHCTTKDPLNVIINAFGKPDSIILVDAIPGGSELAYSENYFIYFIDNAYPEHISIKDKSFSIIIDDTLKIKISDPIEKLKYRFPKTYKTYLTHQNNEIFSIPFVLKTKDQILPKDLYLDFTIANSKITQINILGHD
jgi:hypothetical protein